MEKIKGMVFSFNDSGELERPNIDHMRKILQGIADRIETENKDIDIQPEQG